jgi:putative polyhydroxyalkanoate system protein
MSNISIKQKHALSLKELKYNIEKIKKEIENKLELRSEWESETILVFRRKGASGKIIFDESNFEFSLNLGLKFRMMKNSIHQEVSKTINKYLD